LVDALLSEMTREEKHKFLRGTGWVNYDIQLGYYIGNAAGGQRFGIPSLNMHDSGNGFNNIDITEKSFGNVSGLNYQMPKEVEQVTSFPVALNLASTWSEDLSRRYGEAMGEEFRAKGANCLLGPAVEIHRVPRNGRNAEYLSGESPYLGARLVKPYIRGVQSKRMLASVKHFIANHQEKCRRESNSIVDARTRYEMYYPPFEAAIEADVAMQMCGYNQVNGIWNCGSKEVLVDDLRTSLGFKGWVQSDWWAFHSFEQGREGGVDQEMPGTETWTQKVQYTDEKLNSLTVADVDKSVRPQLDYMLKYGLFEPSDDTCQIGECHSKLYNSTVTDDARQALSQEMATKASVLLRTQGTLLPFGASIKKIALLGSACDSRIDWEEAIKWGVEGASYYHIGGSGRVVPKGVVTIFDGLKEECAKAERGCTIVTYFGDDVATAKTTAEGSDVAIMCGGVKSSEDMDRAHLKVDQHDFILAAATQLTMKKVVLTMTAGTILMPWNDQVDGALTVFNPGKYAGNAFADVLFGVENPSAKSPIFYPTEEQYTTPPTAETSPCNMDNLLQVEYTEKLCVAWHCVDAANILYPFGHGLSYTTFAYSNIALHTTDINAKCPNQDADKGAAVYCVTADVQNSGTRVGSEVAQLYMGFPDGLGEPPKLLRGFHRLEDIAVGATMTAQFPIYRRDLQTYNDNTAVRAWQDHAGSYTFYVGSSAGVTPLQTTVQRTLANSAVTYV
jgi:beta-glucosidase